MSFSNLLRSVSPARLMGRPASSDSRPAVAQQDDLPTSNVPELECEPFGNFYEEHCSFLEFYSKIGYSVNGLAQLLRNSMAEDPMSGLPGRPRVVPPRGETILECTKLMKEIVLVFKTIQAHVEAKTNSVKKDVRRYDPIRHFSSLRELDNHLLEEFLNRETEAVNHRRVQQSTPQQRPVRETVQGSSQQHRSGSPAAAVSTGETRRSTQSGSGPSCESEVLQSDEPPSNEDPTQASTLASPPNRNPLGNWSLGRWLPHTRSSSRASSRGSSVPPAPSSDPSEAMDAMDLGPGSQWTGAPARNIRNQGNQPISQRGCTL